MRDAPTGTPSSSMQPSTRAAIVGALRSHDPSANLGDLDDLVPLIFDELRAMARRQLSHQQVRYTLQTTELVHEAYLRLVRDDGVTRRGRAYFYAAAARAMRQVLVDAARCRNAAKRGSGAVALSLDERTGELDAYADELLDLDAALQELERRNPRFARVVECRFFGGMSVENTAEALGVSPRTVKSDWAMARAWLYDALRGDAA
ncbi:MAG: ECF-type sigma factor [Gemmatimonadaceae bacterium]